MHCDTCGRECAIVSRVVIDRGYNRADARPIYNCPDCFRKKNRERDSGPLPADPPADPACPPRDATGPREEIPENR